MRNSIEEIRQICRGEWKCVAMDFIAFFVFFVVVQNSIRGHWHLRDLIQFHRYLRQASQDLNIVE